MRRLGGLGILLLALTGCGGPETTAPRVEVDKPAAGVIELDGLKSQVPAKWTSEPVKSNMRLAQFRLDGDTEVVIYQGIRGSAKENVARWKGMFTRTEREPTIETFKVGHLDMATLDAIGTYQNAMNQRLAGRTHENFRQFAVHIDTRQGPYHIVMTGPAESVERHKSDFDSWLKGFK